MMFETAKKYGIMYSIFNVILPIAAVSIGIALFISALTPPFGGISAFATGALSGFSVVVSISSFIMFILFLVSMHSLANYYKEPKIFKNILYSFLLSTIVLGVITLIIRINLVTLLYSDISNTNLPTSETVMPLIIGAIAILAVAIVIIVITGILYGQAFTKLGEKSGVNTFKTVGTLYMIGTFLTIIGIGVIILWVSWIYAVGSFRKLQPQSTINTANPTTPTNISDTATLTTISDKIYCSYCGAENIVNIANSIYCVHCGRPLHTNQTDT